jgi:Arc/MetJ-type ribon-helix-helix transcriptional regulator
VNALLPEYSTGSIIGMKVSVSLPDEDVEFLDAYAAEQGFDSRSAVLHKAVRLLKAVELGDAYESAWSEWETTGEADVWETVAADGVTR